MWGVELSIMLVMIAINSIFAGYEIALASISLTRLQRLVQDGRRGAKVAQYMKANMEASLAVVQLGITLVGAIAAATGGAGAEEMISPWLRERWGLSPVPAELLAIATVVVPLTVVTIIFGELVPKVFALRNTEWVCLKLSPAMRWFAFSVWPAVWLLESAVTAIMKWGERRWRPGPEGQSESAGLQELRASAGLARASRLIGAREEGIILGASMLSSRPVREVMLSAEHISMLNATDSIADCLIAAHLDMHSRFPVTERAGDPQAIIGYVNFKDIVAHMRLSPHEPLLHGILRRIPSFAEDLAIASALENLMRERNHIALVRDGAGKVLGMITLEDIIEELVGDIQDEYDLLPVHAVPSGSGWVVGGGISLARLREATSVDLSTDLPPNGARNLTGWLEGHLGRSVRGGDAVERHGVRVVVRKVRREHVLEAQINRTRPAAEVPSPVKADG